ncbi:hypothetical protein DFQ27_009848 [Actinomortierella ambigua]|uniref:Uncharacterized protein n=1 Tax=Actinomortierella ambigua TaxID=1343610 RepID=A0A9P6PMW2_9FUNG|nr:hypothetical protein DFQ27_009848 [Actinomortierella ambigua]
MFDEYQGLVDKINNLKHHRLNHVLSVPQIAIVGDQSSGKSSVLEAVTKLLFPRDKGMCTRFATQVNMCREETLVEDTLSAYIDGEDAFNQRYKVIAADKFHSVIKEAVSLLCRTSDISEKVLELTLSGPTQSPLTIVDLPGFINTTLDGQDKNIPNAIRTINERYMKDSRTIILAVVPANVDLNNSYVLARAEEHDPKNERTVPIVTKPDMIDKGTLPELIDTILNNRKKMRLGYLVMRNTGFADMDLPWEEARQAEDDFFGRDQAWRSVPKASRGRVSVKKFLGDLLFAHIKKELPLLKREVINKTEELRQELSGMGHAIASTHDARAKFSELTMKLQSSLSANLVGAYSQEYMIQFKDEADEFVDGLKTQKSLRFIRSSLQKLYQEYNAAMSKYNCEDLETCDIVATVGRFKGNELPGFVSFSIFRKLFGGTHSTWKAITKEHITNMQLYMCEAIKAYLVHEIEHQAVRGVFLDYYLTFYLQQEKRVNTTLEHIFEDELTPFTFNKYYYDTILKVRADKVQGLIDKLPIASYQAGLPTVHVRNLKVPSADANVNEQNAAEDLGDQLEAYCKVARKRIVDVVLMQTIERHMVRHIGLYFSELIKVDDAKLACLIESEADQRRRKDLEDRVEILERSLLEL